MTAALLNQCPTCLYNGSVLNWAAVILIPKNPGSTGVCPTGRAKNTTLIAGILIKCCCAPALSEYYTNFFDIKLNEII